MLRRVTRQTLRDEPYVLWNEYVHLLSNSAYHDLTALQRVPHLAFWYEHEVQNGGHLQYFENRGIGRLKEVIAALRRLNARCQAEVLSRAGKLWISRGRPTIELAGQYVETALQGEFDAQDRAYYACRPDMPQLLEAFLHAHQGAFIEVVE